MNVVSMTISCLLHIIRVFSFCLAISSCVFLIVFIIDWLIFDSTTKFNRWWWKQIFVKKKKTIYVFLLVSSLLKFDLFVSYLFMFLFYVSNVDCPVHWIQTTRREKSAKFLFSSHKEKDPARFGEIIVYTIQLVPSVFTCLITLSLVNYLFNFCFVKRFQLFNCFDCNQEECKILGLRTLRIFRYRLGNIQY